MRRLCAISFFCLAAFAAATRPAAALPFVVAETFSAGPSGMFGSFGVTPFDPTLGTLNSISIDITGVLRVQVFAPQNLVMAGFGLTPQPYSFGVDVEQTFLGELDKYFEFNGPAWFHLTGNTIGTGELVTLSTLFTYGMTFSASTDLTGGLTVPSVSSSVGTLIPPVGVTALRSDFVETIIPHDVIDLFQSITFSGVLPSLTPTLQQLSADGSFIMTYNYTPATPQAAPVPEPAAMLLVGCGLAVRARRRMKR